MFTNENRNVALSGKCCLKSVIASSLPSPLGSVGVMSNDFDVVFQEIKTDAFTAIVPPFATLPFQLLMEMSLLTDPVQRAAVTATAFRESIAPDKISEWDALAYPQAIEVLTKWMVVNE